MARPKILLGRKFIAFTHVLLKSISAAGAVAGGRRHRLAVFKAVWICGSSGHPKYVRSLRYTMLGGLLRASTTIFMRLNARPSPEMATISAE